MQLLRLLAVLVLSVLVVPVTAAPIVIKFSHVVAENTPKNQAALKFKELMEQRLPGRVVVEVFPNSQLFDDDKVLSAMLLGDVQLAAPSLSKFGKFTDKLNVFDLPFLFQDMSAVDRFMHSAKGKDLMQSMRKKGLVGLGFLHNGMKQLSANKPLRVPADAAGLKFRIQTSDVLAAQFQAVGATPLKKPFSEVFTLMQTKAIDGAENPWSNIYSKKFHEVQDYITESNHGYLGYLVVTSTEFLEGLPDDVREVFESSLETAIHHGNEIAREKEIADRQAIIDSGRTKVIELTAEERNSWVEAMKPVWKQFEGEVGKDLIDAAQASDQ